MRTGSCAYGTDCKFNHPDPTGADGSNTFISDTSGFGYHSSGNYNSESNALPFSAEQTAASLSLNMMSDKHLPCINHNSSYPHEMHPDSEWNRYQVAMLSPQSTKFVYPFLLLSSFISKKKL